MPGQNDGRSAACTVFHKTPRNATNWKFLLTISEVGLTLFVSATWSPAYYTNETKTHAIFLPHRYPCPRGTEISPCPGVYEDIERRRDFPVQLTWQAWCEAKPQSQAGVGFG